MVPSPSTTGWMGAAQSQDLIPVSLSLQQAGSSRRSPLPRRLHNLPLIPDTPGMRWCPMSKYLSTTQISCLGSLSREERVSHGLASIPGDGCLSPCAGERTVHLRGLAEFKSHLGRS